MELLAANQPWNLIFFMAIPVILAESLVATEFFVVHRRLTGGVLRTWNKWLGIVLGFYFMGVFLYLMATTVPKIAWRGPFDVIAVGAYLSGVIPLFWIALQELGVVGRVTASEAAMIARGKTVDGRMQRHFVLLTVFLVVAHVAMIFGMLDPALLTGGKMGM
ncbi:MAG: DUF6803 family protein [Bacteroidota bacterium]